jgi:UPF0176 protein
MQQNSHQNYLILAYYLFAPIEDPYKEVDHHHTFFLNRNTTGRIYISHQGINGQMSGSHQDAQEYMEWMKRHPLFSEVEFKIQEYHENVFPRMTIKYRKHLVAFDHEIDLTKRGEYLSPKRWKEMLEKKQEHVLLDVRNDYEWKLGRFAGAECPPCETFRDFATYSDSLKEKIDPKQTPVMMYCTGGIRCELYSAILKEKGFDKVYQLKGGIINYGAKVGSDHWLGKVFVFDDRLSIPISQKPTSIIGNCHHCDRENETYYNCANMDCNFLFLCCPDCLKKFAGCCKEECRGATRIRPYHHQNPHKPFRKWYHYFKEKKEVQGT